ncbi:MAG: ribosome biogenesis GTPase Der [Holosporaceae bacterium]|jgi:GTP-binding protein|nr:ribosome biogenesis GTPase Der [Holosporaceae bacterium]
MKIAIIGRPNVGKSSLFNRLAGKKSAIVGNMPGITRDRKHVGGDLCGLRFDVSDTPGIDPFSDDPLAVSMNSQSLAAIRESDIIFFVVDPEEGAVEYDKAVADWIRKAFKTFGNRPVILIKNKSEGKLRLQNPEILGFGEGIAVSAEHNLGMDEIYSRLSVYEFPEEKISDEDSADVIKIAVVGRPNAGKSTLINSILGEERLLTGEQGGTTRDSISSDLTIGGRRFSLVDTAGQRKRAKIEEKIEAAAVIDAQKHIRRANVVAVLTDIRNPLESQDITVASQALDEGKIVMFLLSKSDVADNPDEVLKSIKIRVKNEFARLPGVACLTVSAKEKKGLRKIFNTALKLYEGWCRRISTGALNKWLQRAVSQNPPPLAKGMPVKLKYVSQVACRPPTFALFATRAEHLPESYKRYLSNHLRKSFGFEGVPLRILFRQPENPYDK